MQSALGAVPRQSRDVKKRLLPERTESGAMDQREREERFSAPVQRRWSGVLHYVLRKTDPTSAQDLVADTSSSPGVAGVMPPGTYEREDAALAAGTRWRDLVEPAPRSGPS
jgi:hypothetical protein